MNVTVHVISLSAKGVQCVTPASTDDGFWLPRAHVTWSEPPEPGAKVSATVPAWLTQKHKQLVHLRGQYAIPLTPMPGLDPVRSQEKIPMADQSNDLRGALFRNDKKESDRHPDYKGDILIEGRKFWLSGWIKEGKRGKYLSLAAKPADEKRQEQQRPQPEQQNAYAAAKQGRAGGPTFRDDEAIPF